MSEALAIAMPKYKAGVPGNNAVVKLYDSTASFAQNQLYTTVGSGAVTGVAPNDEPLENRRKSKQMLARMGIGFYRYSVRNTAQDVTLNLYWSKDSGETWVLFSGPTVLAAATTPTEATVDIRAYEDFKAEVTAGATGPTLFSVDQALLHFTTGGS